MSLRFPGVIGFLLLFGSLPVAGAEFAPSRLDAEVLSILKSRCVKCHGPAKREAKLNLASPKGIARGGKHGKSVVPGKAGESLIWKKVVEEEMPPDEPLPEEERIVINRWIDAGAPGLPTVSADEPESADHWAFAALRKPSPPTVKEAERVRNGVDRFVQASLEVAGLSPAKEADRETLVRRASFDLTGLPPTIEEVQGFVADTSPNAYEKMIDRYLASPRYGERWGKYWLDVAGYADSNGYFSADSDRPLAHRYRDYVIRSWNKDLPFDEFLRQQLAGDELAGYRRGDKASAETVEKLVATHFLRNSPDGTGESDGNPDEVRADRFAVLEGTIEILGSSLFGMTFQCARCHDHKFEPIAQQDYYRLQAILYGAFPVDAWSKPNDRVVEAPLPGELEAWESRAKAIDGELAKLKAEFRSWSESNREKGRVLFEDDFEYMKGSLSDQWRSSSPAAGKSVAVGIDSEKAPGAKAKGGVLGIVESGAAGTRRISTRRTFDWTPDVEGAWIQATFELVDRKGAERVGYYIGVTDDDAGPPALGNILLDGNPAGGAPVNLDYPGPRSRQVGVAGAEPYESGRRYGLRITNAGQGKFRLEHVVDWAPEGKPITLSAADLGRGGFGFEYCCGRSFDVDDLIVETNDESSPKAKTAAEAFRKRRGEYEKTRKSLEARRGQRPGRLAWVSDLGPKPPDTHLLRRGVYTDRGPKVEPAPPSALVEPSNPFEIVPGPSTTGRRLAFARWITKAGSRPAALLARVTANRLWQNHFGTGIIATPENLGYSGVPPVNPELLDYLAALLVESGWSMKSIHREIMNSATYRRSSVPDPRALAADPDNLLFSRFPLRRLDAEAVRDAMLSVSGDLDPRTGGPYVPSGRSSEGEVTVDESIDGARKRSIYLQQRRTQVVGMLEVFDGPSIVTNCSRRNSTTIPLQSLNLLNSEFTRTRAKSLAARLAREAGTEPRARVERLFLLALGRAPSDSESAAASRFLAEQPGRYPGAADAGANAWIDLCQMILASNAFLYVE